MLTREQPDPRRALNIGMGVASPLWPAFAAMAGAGVAFWWWGRLMRGQVQSGALSSLPAPFPLMRSPNPAAPAPAAEALQPAVGPALAPEPAAPPAAVEIAPPELVMAHNPAPPEAPDLEAHPTDHELAVAPAEVLAHTPPETVGVSFKEGTGLEPRASETEPHFPRHGAGVVADDQSDEQRLKGPVAQVSPPPPRFDPEVLATETSVAALTAGEILDEIVPPDAASGITDSLGVQGAASTDTPAKSPKRRKAPGTAPQNG